MGGGWERPWSLSERETGEGMEVEGGGLRGVSHTGSRSGANGALSSIY